MQPAVVIRDLIRACVALPAGGVALAACALVLALPALPSAGISGAMIAAGAVIAATGVASWRRGRDANGRLMWAAAIFVAMAGWSMLGARQALDARLPPTLEGVDLVVVGVVERTQPPSAHGARFDLRVESARRGDGDAVDLAGRRLRLGWSHPRGPAVQSVARAEIWPGQRWRIAVRLKRPHASVNPGLFDAELRLLEEGVAALGSVRTARAWADEHQLLDAFVWTPARAVEYARSWLHGRLKQASQGIDAAARGVLIALVIGEQSAIAQGWWERFNRTGVGHLMSISGLHITMLAGLAGGLAGWLWRRRRWRMLIGPRIESWWPTPVVRILVGISVAFAYSALAGWGIPAQRTCWMLAGAGFALLTGRGRGAQDILSCSLLAVLIGDPWAPLAAGFWLSFFAVGILVWAGAQRHSQARSWAWLREAIAAQWTISVALVPLTLVFFSAVSVVGPLANAIAIPLVSALITPLALVGALLEALRQGFGAWPIALSGAAIEWLLQCLVWLDRPGISALPVAQPSAWLAALATIGLVIHLAPGRLPGRGVALLAALPLACLEADAPPPDELWLTALDVGQGSALLLETAEGRLMFDTGPAYSPQSDAATRVLLPYLRARGIARLDVLVLSHLDGDHTGGAASLLAGLPVGRVLTSIAADHPLVANLPNHGYCRRGEGWRWGKVRFDWLHPGDEDRPRAKKSTNAGSCVLRVASPAGTVLLPGDLDTANERRLIELLPADALRADVLIAPHHGSRSSSSIEWLRAVQPRWTIYQLGYRNRFGHPDPRVDERYRREGVERLRTDHHGAIRLRLRDGRVIGVERARTDRPPYWRLWLAVATSPAGDDEP